MNTFTKIAIATFAMVGVASAQPKTEPKAPADVKAKVEPKIDPKAAKPEAMKPPAELEAMGKAVVGTWKCTGTEMGMDGSTGKIAGTVKAKVELDKWWIADTIEMKGARTFKMLAFTTFEPNSKKWRRVSVDNAGHQYVGTSDGMKDNKVDWNMDFIGSMGAGQMRDHIDMTDPKNMKNWGEISMDKGKTWVKIFEMTCKK